MKCKVRGCQKITQYKNTKNYYCMMHLARIRRHGYIELKKERGEHATQKLPHKIVNKLILSLSEKMNDEGIAALLREKGYGDITRYNVGYRRRKLGKRKYLLGEIKKHKAWVRDQAIKFYGERCELCGFGMVVDIHHIIPKYMGGEHSIDNLIVICPNCHALITRRVMILKSRKDIPVISSEMIKVVKSYYIFPDK